MSGDGAARPRLIRRVAFELVFQFDALGLGVVDDEALSRALCSSDAAEGLNDGGRSRASSLAVGAWGSRREIDGLIARTTPAWPAHRMAATDRALVRLALHEIRAGVVSRAVVINEAVELAREYGTERSAAFVNGVLDEAADALVGGVSDDGGLDGDGGEDVGGDGDVGSSERVV